MVMQDITPFSRRLPKLLVAAVLAAPLLFVSSRASAAVESISFVGVTSLTSTLGVEDGPVPAGPYLSNARFPDGSNAAAFGTLLSSYCANSAWSGSTFSPSSCTGGGTSGTGSKTCSGTGNACAAGPNDDDYCYATTLGSWNCGVPATAPVPGYTASGATQSYASQWAGGSSCTNTTALPNTVAQSGAAVSIDNNDPYVLAPFNPCDVASGLNPLGTSPTLKLAVGASGNAIPASAYDLVLYVSNPTSSQTNGCFTVTADGTASNSENVQLPALHGQLLEWSVTNAPSASSITATETANCASGDNVKLTGFFLLSKSTPTAAPYIGLHESFGHGYTTIRWRSTRRVAGFNVWWRGRKLNHALVTSRTARYKLRIRGVVFRPRLVPVELRGLPR
jgi:hypothetical protein